MHKCRHKLERSTIVQNADDLMLICSNIDIMLICSNIESLQCVVKSFSDIFAKHGLKINISKTKFMSILPENFSNNINNNNFSDNNISFNDNISDNNNIYDNNNFSSCQSYQRTSATISITTTPATTTLETTPATATLETTTTTATTEVV